MGRVVASLFDEGTRCAFIVPDRKGQVDGFECLDKQYAEEEIRRRYPEAEIEWR